MATPKQIEANRRNAQKSTGPRTEEGKVACRFNSLKHGMTAQTAVLPHEDKLSYEELHTSLLSSYQPVGPGETMLVNLIAVNYWRLLRARRVECASLELHIATVKNRNGIDMAPTEEDDHALAAAFADPKDTFKAVERYQTSIERSYYRAVESLRKTQNDRIRQERFEAANRPQAEPAQTAPVQIGSVSKTRAAGSTAGSTSDPDITFSPAVRTQHTSPLKDGPFLLQPEPQ